MHSIAWPSAGIYITKTTNDVAESSASADSLFFGLAAFNFSSAPSFLASFHSFHSFRYFIDLQIPATRHLHCSSGRLLGMAHS